LDEKHIQKACLDWLKDHGFWVWRAPLAGMKLGGGGMAPNPMAGHPDLAGILTGSGGRYFAVECKKPGGRFRPKQIEWAARATNEKVFYLVAYSVADVIRAFSPYVPKLTKAEIDDAVESVGESSL
jgi:hypothetical protein